MARAEHGLHATRATYGNVVISTQNLHPSVPPSLPPSLSIYLPTDRPTYLPTYLLTYLPTYLYLQYLPTQFHREFPMLDEIL